MYNHMIKRIDVDILDCSCATERQYIKGDGEIALAKWDIRPSIKYFEKSEASIKFSGLPQDLLDIYNQFEKALIDYLLRTGS